MKIEIHFKIKVSFRKEYAKAKEGENIYIWWDRRLIRAIIVDSKYAWETHYESLAPEWSAEKTKYDISM